MENLQSNEPRVRFPAGVTISDAIRFIEPVSNRNRHLEDCQFILNLLLDASSYSRPLPGSKEHSVWKKEADHRSGELLHLMLLTSRRVASLSKSNRGSDNKKKVAVQLVRDFRVLEWCAAGTPVGFNDLLTSIIEHSLLLFANALYPIKFIRSGADFAICSIRRRAMILALNALVIEAVKASCIRGRGANILINIERCGEHMIRLIFSDDIVTLPSVFVSPSFKLVCDLAGVVGAELAFRVNEFDAKQVEFLMAI